MVWIPKVDYILELFKDQIENPILINREGLISTLDKVQWGIPSQGGPSIWDQATILYQDIIINHYFADGNKRISSLLGYIFLRNNGYKFSPPIGELFSFTMEVAQGLRPFEEVKKWLRMNSTKE